MAEKSKLNKFCENVGQFYASCVVGIETEGRMAKKHVFTIISVVHKVHNSVYTKVICVF